MDGIKWLVVMLVFSPMLINAWKQFTPERKGYDPRRSIHSHTKRHMLAEDEPSESRKRLAGLRARDNRKKPSGHLTPLKEDDIENDEVISVAIGPPPMRPKYDRFLAKVTTPKPAPNFTNIASTNIIKDIFLELGREFLTRQVSEDFVFGQYVGSAMKNLTPELKLNMQHEILNLIIKYQKPIDEGNKSENNIKLDKTLGINDTRVEKKVGNDTVDDIWPDFSNIAKNVVI